MNTNRPLLCSIGLTFYFPARNILYPRQEYEVQMIYGGIDLEYLKYWFKRTNFLL